MDQRSRAEARRESLAAAEHSVTRILADARTLESCAGEILRVIGRALGADLGELWMPRSDGRLANVASVPCSTIAGIAILESSARALTFSPGEGIPGIVWSTGEPFWTTNFDAGVPFYRANLAKRLGIRCAMGYPIRRENDVVGVIVFLGTLCDAPDAAALASMGTLGSEIGEFAARRTAETEVERLKAALGSRDVELETVLEVAPVGIAVALDPECRVVRVNRAAADLLGIPLGQYPSLSTPEGAALGIHVLRAGRLLSSDELPLKRSTRGENVDNEELQLVRADGESREILVRARPLRDSSGALRGGLASIDDVTPLRRAEEAARVSRERLDLAVRSSELGLWYCDLGPPREADELCTRLSALRCDASLASHFGLADGAPPAPKELEARIHPDDRAAARAALERGLREPGSFALELRTVGVDGRVRWIRAVGTVSTNAAGRAARFDGVTIDITEQKAIEDALRESARRKDDFLALLGHELRNPLAAIRNSLAVLGLPNVSQEPSKKAREMAERQLGHLTRLVDDLLDVSRISRGKIELKRATFDLVGLVRSTVEDHRTAAEARGITVAVALPSGRVDVTADATRVAQSLGNLLQNAFKFTQRGGRVSVRLSPRGSAAELEVSDDGIGMDAATLQAVFEPFRQVDHRRGGLGLGLAVARRLVELNGGTLTASSPGLGKGSRFLLSLPVAETRAAPSPAPAPPAPLPELASRRRVLIVEDNVDAAQSLAAFLELIGHEVSVAHDGRAGIENALRLAPEVVLCDIDLPGLDGYEVATALRREPTLRSTYLVALTGYGQAEDRRRARETGFDAHLTKPTDPAAIERLLARLPAVGPAPTPSVERTFF